MAEMITNGPQRAMHVPRHTLLQTLNVPTKVPHMAIELFSAVDTPKSVTLTCVRVYGFGSWSQHAAGKWGTELSVYGFIL